MRFLARPRADSRSIHAGARSPSPGTPPGSLSDGRLSRGSHSGLSFSRWCLSGLSDSRCPLSDCSRGSPPSQSDSVLSGLAHSGSRHCVRAFTRRRPGPPPVRGVGLPLSSAGWSLSGLLFSVLSHSGQWHAARFPHSACPFCGSRVSVCPFSGVGDYDSSRGGGQSDSGLPDSCWSRIKRTPPGIEPATFCPAVRRLNHSAMVPDSSLGTPSRLSRRGVECRTQGVGQTARADCSQSDLPQARIAPRAFPSPARGAVPGTVRAQAGTGVSP